MPITDPKVIVALDFPDEASTMQLVEQLHPEQCRLKIGKELFTRSGPDLVRRLVDAGYDVFLDLKYHDIPNTVAKACMAAADLGVVMRTPSAGETSAAAVRFLATGTPVAVSGLHQFLEWPEEAAPRVTPGPSAPAELARLLAEAWAGGEVWEARRRAARAAYEENHRPEKAAKAIVEFLEALAPTR